MTEIPCRSALIRPRGGAFSGLVGGVGGRAPRTGNASSQALAACRAEVRDANTTVELR